MTFTVYENQNGQAIDIGNVSASDFETAKAFVISEGYEESEFMLIRIDEYALASHSRMSPYERTRAAVYATGNRWAIENFNATH